MQERAPFVRREGSPNSRKNHFGAVILRATAVASQLPVDKWLAATADPTLGEACGSPSALS